LPDGGIFGKTTENRPYYKKVLGRQKLEDVKCQNFAKNSRIEAGKHFNNYLKEETFII
jgi:hypothetical protein